MLPILRIIMLAEETVEANDMLSVDMFFIRKRLLLPFSLVNSLGAVAVASVPARLTSLPIAAGIANGADGAGKSWDGVVGGVAERVEVSEGEVKTGLGALIGVDLAGGDGVEVLASRFESFSNAFLSLPFRPPVFIIFSVGSGDAAMEDCDKGDDRFAAGGMELVALAIGPVWRGVGTARMVGVEDSALVRTLAEAVGRDAGLPLESSSFFTSVSVRVPMERTDESELEVR
jgi:hypothetical protein